jgi:hypothetical protein
VKNKSAIEEGQVRADTFDWSSIFDCSLTEALQCMTDVCGLQAQRACAELERAIGAAEIRHRFFKKIDGKLVSLQEGSPEFWRTEVTLRSVDKDASGNAIETEVQIWPKRIAFEDGRGVVVCRVRSRDIQGKYSTWNTQSPYANKSRTEQMILLFTDEKFPDGWEVYPTNVLMKRVGKRFEDRDLPVPERSTFERAYDRRTK